MVFRSFAVVGAGNIGSFVIAELLRLKAIGTVSSVTVVSRSDASASHPEWVTQGAKFAIIDYSDRPTLLDAFDDVDVVVSTVNSGPDAVRGQKALADAAKAAGVKIFTPSEFGTSPAKMEGRYVLKGEIRDYLQEIELPYAILHTGPWSDFIFIPRFGFDFPNEKAAVLGNGDAPISFTGRPDVARFIGFVFTNLPAEKLEWKILRLEGERTTFNEILRSYQEKTGKTLEITHIPPSELEKRTDFAAGIALRWERGEGVVGDPVDNDLYPGWNPKKVLEYIA